MLFTPSIYHPRQRSLCNCSVFLLESSLLPLARCLFPVALLLPKSVDRPHTPDASQPVLVAPTFPRVVLAPPPLLVSLSSVPRVLPVGGPHRKNVFSFPPPALAATPLRLPATQQESVTPTLGMCESSEGDCRVP